MSDDVVRVELTDIARTELAQRAELALADLEPRRNRWRGGAVRATSTCAGGILRLIGTYREGCGALGGGSRSPHESGGTKRQTGRCQR